MLNIKKIIYLYIYVYIYRERDRERERERETDKQRERERKGVDLFACGKERYLVKQYERKKERRLRMEAYVHVFFVLGNKYVNTKMS